MNGRETGQQIQWGPGTWTAYRETGTLHTTAVCLLKSPWYSIMVLKRRWLWFGPAGRVDKTVVYFMDVGGLALWRSATFSGQFSRIG